MDHVMEQVLEHKVVMIVGDHGSVQPEQAVGDLKQLSVN
jgi:hypothetical protein